MSAPPTRGPAIAPAWKTVVDSELAAGSCAAGISLGRIAERVGWFTAKNACWSANRHSSSQTSCSPSAAWTQNSPLVTISPTVVTSSTLRRSKWSASAPP